MRCALRPLSLAVAAASGPPYFALTLDPVHITAFVCPVTFHSPRATWGI